VEDDGVDGVDFGGDFGAELIGKAESVGVEVCVFVEHDDDGDGWVYACALVFIEED